MYYPHPPGPAARLAWQLVSEYTLTSEHPPASQAERLVEHFVLDFLTLGCDHEKEPTFALYDDDD